jgi:cholesterol transport system auxiliary component
MTPLRLLRTACLLAAAGAAWVTGGCGALQPKAARPPAFYALDGAPAAGPGAATHSRPLPATGLTLIVSPSQAAAGFDGPHMVYLRQAHQLEHFAYSHWVDTPARMLTPLITQALAAGTKIRTAVPSTTGGSGELRLDTEIVRLQHDFSQQPSRVRFTLRATLMDDLTRRVLALREFDETVLAATDDPYGGVVAANQAVQAVLQGLAGFCNQAATTWQPDAGTPDRGTGSAGRAGP